MTAKKSPGLSVVIVNWNAGRQLRDCVSSISVADRNAFTLSDVVIVDNGSTDQSLDGIENVGVPVRVIRNEKNRGFAAACNQGAAGATGDYLLFLNPDTRLFESSLSGPVEFMERPGNSGIGICGIRLVDEENRVSTCAARFPTLRVMAGEILGLTRLFPVAFPPHLVPPEDLRRSGLVDQVIGAFFLIRRAVFDRCGGFDERFFVYFEEVDLSLRAKRLGYASFFLSDVSAFHRGGGCSGQVKAARLFYSLRSRILYAQKHYSAPAFVGLVLLTMLELPIRLVHGAWRVSGADMKNCLIAYRRLFAYFLWRERDGAV